MARKYTREQKTVWVDIPHEICDVCGAEIQGGVWPRIKLKMKWGVAVTEDDQSQKLKADLCSIECLTTLVQRLRPDRVYRSEKSFDTTVE